MGREHDTRSQRTRDLTVEDQRGEALRRAFGRPEAVLVNAAQAGAIAELCAYGKQAGDALADPVPLVVAVTGVGPRRVLPSGEAVRQVGLLAGDGRTWSVTDDGECWPGGTTFKDAARARRG
jgi:hypothetical protein